MTPVRDPSRLLNLFHRHNLQNTKQILAENTADTGLFLNAFYTRNVWQFEITNTEHYHSHTAHRLLRGCTGIATTHKVNLHSCVYTTQEIAHFRVAAENFSNCNTHNRSHDVWEMKQTVHLTLFLLTTWLYLNKWHGRMISSLSSTTYCICSPLRITWRTRSVQQIAQFTCLVQLIPSTYPVIHIKLLCLLVTRPLTWSPTISLGLCKQNSRSLKISGLSAGRTSPSLVQLLTTFLYPLLFIYFSGTSSTMAR